MGRLSIELPEHQHKKIKALAAWRGLSIKDYIIEKALSVSAKSDEDEAHEEFMKFLAPRIESARRGRSSRLSMDEIIAKAKSRRRS